MKQPSCGFTMFDRYKNELWTNQSIPGVQLPTVSIVPSHLGDD